MGNGATKLFQPSVFGIYCYTSQLSTSLAIEVKASVVPPPLHRAPEVEIQAVRFPRLQALSYMHGRSAPSARSESNLWPRSEETAQLP